MNSNNYEQSFLQNVNSSTPPPATPKTPSNGPLLFIAALAVISIIMQAISLIFLSNTYNALADVTAQYANDVEDETEEEFAIYTYNQDGSIKSMTETCQNNSYGYYIFEENGIFEQYDNNPQSTDSIDAGTYRFSGDNAIVLNSVNSGERTLNFNKTSLSEDNRTYTCLNATEGESEE